MDGLNAFHLFMHIFQYILFDIVMSSWILLLVFAHLLNSMQRSFNFKQVHICLNDTLTHSFSWKGETKSIFKNTIETSLKNFMNHLNEKIVPGYLVQRTSDNCFLKSANQPRIHLEWKCLSSKTLCANSNYRSTSCGNHCYGF